MGGAVFAEAMRTRIAPTPSGFLHVGNGINFSAISQLAKAYDGRILLRIDDLDTERVREEYIDDIFRTLEWLGIEWHEGPTGPDDLRKQWSQHARMAHYVELLAQLRSRNMLYACDCSRSQIAEIAPDGRYPGKCRDLQKPLDSEDHALRMGSEVDARATFNEAGVGSRTLDPSFPAGDPVVRTKASGAGPARPAYHIASLADDLFFRINTIVRGEDLLAGTAVQVHIAQLLDLSAFARAAFLHHPLSTDAQGRKLSKSAGADALRTWRSSGRSPEPIHTAARSLLTARGLLVDAG
jgi:glutamyl/glutaminyl-tRNA synthetase